MSDRVFIRELRIETVIGVYPWEREVRQQLLVDLEMAWDMTAASAGDRVEDALNYAAVSQRLQDFAREHAFQLIEKLADEMARVIMAEFAVPWLLLRLCKPGAVPEARDVGVLIERGRLPG